ncbi:MAG: Crp/Fnr family transcriptional regulator [Bacteroidota bacterium]
MSNIWVLEETNLFKVLCPHKFAEYRKRHQFDKYDKDEFIYFNEDAANKIYLIVRGKVKIASYNTEGDELVKSILSKGEVFGELAVLDAEKRSEFAQSLSKTTVCVVGMETVKELMRDNYELVITLNKVISFRIKRLERRLELLMFKEVKTRLIEFIKEILREGKACQSEHPELMEADHFFTQKDVAHLIGTSRQTVNKLLGELKEEGVLVEFTRKKIIVNKSRIASVA